MFKEIAGRGSGPLGTDSAQSIRQSGQERHPAPFRPGLTRFPLQPQAPVFLVPTGIVRSTGLDG